MQLKAGPQAIDYLDPAQDVGRYVSLKDLRLEGQDTQNSVWQASRLLFAMAKISIQSTKQCMSTLAGSVVQSAGTENSSIAFLQPPRGKPGAAVGATDTAKQLAEWSRNSKELLTALQLRIQCLFGGNQGRQ